VPEERHDSRDLLRPHGDLAVAVLAERQSGVVSTAQLRAVGLARGAVHHRVKRGRLHPVHRGVYAVGHTRLTFRGRLWAAVLACDGVVSHRSAAAVWDLLPVPSGKLDVTTARACKSRAELRVHHATTRDVLRRADGLPVTTVARTIFDLAPVLTLHRLERVCHRAEVLRIPDAAPLTALLDAHPRRAGVPAVRAALATLAAGDPQMTRNELEERFLELVALAGLPRPLASSDSRGAGSPRTRRA
jgi:hypothetical protein